jgi:lipopolysaccharide transport system ATP-binding protein
MAKAEGRKAKVESPNGESDGDLGDDEMWALRGVSFEVKQGEILGIIGRNGAGKSTLLKILSRVTAPTKGEVRIKGRIVSLLEVGTGFHPELTGRENIFLNGGILGMTRSETKKKFDEIVDFAGVERYMDTPVKRYSSGMYVRLAFAVAAHLEAQILIVDEVLAVGDIQFQKKCLGKMGEVAHAGRTVLFVSHNMTAIRALCERGLLLDDGILVKNGTTEEAIRAYLQSVSQPRMQLEWDRENAPGNESVRVHAVELIPETQGEQGMMDVRATLRVRFAFWSLADGQTLNLALHLYSLEGACIFAVASPAVQGARGLWEGVCVIPGGFLNDGAYTISMMIVQDQSLCLYNLDRALTFEIADFREPGAWHGKWPGAVRPKNLSFTLQPRGSDV